MEKISKLVKNQHPTFKIIRFRTLSYCFLIWAFWWGINFFYFFKNYISELMDIPEWKKYSCMQKISILTSNLSVLEPYFSFPKGAILTSRCENMKTSIKSIKLGLGIKRNLFWDPQSINFMKITTRNTGTKFC